MNDVVNGNVNIGWLIEKRSNFSTSIIGQVRKRYSLDSGEFAILCS